MCLHKERIFFPKQSDGLCGVHKNLQKSFLPVDKPNPKIQKKNIPKPKNNYKKKKFNFIKFDIFSYFPIDKNENNIEINNLIENINEFLKILDFLQKNLHFLGKNSDFSTETLDFLDHIVDLPDPCRLNNTEKQAITLENYNIKRQLLDNCSEMRNLKTTNENLINIIKNLNDKNPFITIKKILKEKNDLKDFINNFIDTEEGLSNTLKCLLESKKKCDVNTIKFKYIKNFLL